MPEIKRKWEHGYVREDGEGRDCFYIRGTWAGKRFDFSTRCHTEAGAYKVFYAFEKDPHGFSFGGEIGGRLVLDPPLVASFLVWSREKGNTPKHVGEHRRDMKFWGKALAGKNLKKLDLGRDILLPLEGVPPRSKIRTLKTFLAWLREVKHLLKTEEDPTFGQLKNLPGRATQSSRRKAFSIEEHQMLIKASTGLEVSVLTVLAGTGWHVTEVHRFAKAGAIEGDVLVCPQHKTGGEHRTRVTPTTLVEAEKLLKHGGFSVERFSRAINKKAKELKLTARIGAYRHAVGHLQVEQGATMHEVGTFLGHKDPRTTKKFYAGLATPKKLPTLN